MSKYQVVGSLKEISYFTIKYLNQKKIDRRKCCFIRKTVIAIGKLVGFENPNNLIFQFKKQCNVTPQVYRRRACIEGSVMNTTWKDGGFVKGTGKSTDKTP